MAAVAVAHELLIAAYHIMATDCEAYRELGPDHLATRDLRADPGKGLGVPGHWEGDLILARRGRDRHWLSGPANS